MFALPRRRFLATAMLGMLGVLSALPAAAQNYPVRPITLIVPWGAGGGTDATARIIGSLLEKDLGQPVNVVNRTGGSGVVGHAAIASAQPDGYTIGLATVEIGMMHWQGLTDLTSASYTPIGFGQCRPSGCSSPCRFALQNRERTVGGHQGQPRQIQSLRHRPRRHLALGHCRPLRDQKIDPAALPWVPSNGAAPGLQDMVAGGIEVAPVSLPEARSLIDAGKVKSLAIMNDKPSALYPNVPTLKAATGSDWTMAAWRGIVAPKGLPAPVRDKLAEAVRKVAASKEYNEIHGQSWLWCDLCRSR
jgi:tripartite-type tricarboxylate transporter receptor subunit TctC